MFNLYFILFSWHIIYSPLSISLTHTHTFKKKKISSHIMNSLVWFSETHTDSDTFMLTHVQSHTFTQRAPSDTEISLETYSSIPVPPFLPLPSPPLLASRPLCSPAMPLVFISLLCLLFPQPSHPSHLSPRPLGGSNYFFGFISLPSLTVSLFLLHACVTFISFWIVADSLFPLENISVRFLHPTQTAAEFQDDFQSPFNL